MGTAEILIVFSALMALIALVTIGIDWIGKPLKHRRFIPRMYRFDDEKLPVDEYGNTRFDPLYGEPIYPYPATPVAPAPYAPAPHAVAPESPPVAYGANPTVVVPNQPPPQKVAQVDLAATAGAAAATTSTASAFTDSLAGTAPLTADPQVAGVGDPGSGGHDTIAGTRGNSAVAAPASSWNPTMALDTTVNDQKPSLAIKAERFWMATADASHGSHFDSEDLARMQSGKAPRRTNPRTGRSEAMQLTGLRQASARTDVRMRWPDDAVDPWSAS